MFSVYLSKYELYDPLHKKQSLLIPTLLLNKQRMCVHVIPEDIVHPNSTHEVNYTHIFSFSVKVAFILPYASFEHETKPMPGNKARPLTASV
jgi:hypothetical protein